ncbi:glycosyltransferase family 2 protein [Demequina rhizosphaerae]|uniref:glycosyltransferase family 2 protein n=1 Tax=Demequina rhizosphaerae TaxID=1638985 RepID=UPI000784E8AF|nr:glycosyltransferase family 2 protein [Demequina rhizosphaerae]
MTNHATQSAPLLSFVLPVFNEVGNISLLHEELSQVTALRPDFEVEFIFINDGSDDDSLDALERLAQQDSRVTVIDFARNFGHQFAVTAGLDHARGDAVIIMDTDLQDPPAVCLDLISAWEAGADVVYAQRTSRKDTVFKRVTADAFYRALSRLSDVPIPRNTGDFRLMDRAVVDYVNTMREPHRFLRGMVAYVGFTQVAVPFEREARHAGATGYPLRKMVRFAADGLLGFSIAPLRLILATGYTFSGLAFLGIVYAILMKFLAPQVTVDGWTFIVISILLMGGVQLIMLGIIGAYVGRIYSTSQQRPLYVVRRLTAASSRAHRTERG